MIYGPAVGGLKANSFVLTLFGSKTNAFHTLNEAQTENRSRPHVVAYRMRNFFVFEKFDRKISLVEKFLPTLSPPSGFTLMLSLKAGFRSQHVTIHTKFQRDTNKFNSK